MYNDSAPIPEVFFTYVWRNK